METLKGVLQMLLWEIMIINRFKKNHEFNDINFITNENRKII